MSVDLGGVLAIPVTPFNSDGTVDTGSLEELVETFIRNGADVLVGPVFVSEFYTLTDRERDTFLETVVAATNGRVPVIAGVSSPSTGQAVQATRTAAGAGADAVIAMPPYVRAGTSTEITEHFLAIADAADGLPLMMQNAPQPVGVQMPVPQMLDVIARASVPVWVKEETLRATQNIGALVEEAPEGFGGVVGGIAGIYLVEEFARGSKGTMPSGEFVDMHGILWKTLLDEGPASARSLELFSALLPLLSMEHQYGITFCKEVLAMRGALTRTDSREPNRVPFDDVTRRVVGYQLDRACEVFGVSRALA